eukprot:CAMPEP_0113297844 /NCGR_PEP_ID=MMETSP0010_2-20120614/533_1 /TAXON_ID=216773 ORGANISM="Corethron hystrix, Strain 308" /NCGR_SAMPLE_ID=MMETSP0010_2 /ASSEMBLY_ACC=CAM_ASM_000155 /LENGTH=525 /DNA_ID=CAMNT_0000150793 /DNA_START=21 /DNA_END=1598 /DNA_ORIENTATION=+ /assembly_acc=CAM_ASM_000155
MATAATSSVPPLPSVGGTTYPGMSTRSILILYKIVNAEGEKSGPMNAFELPKEALRGRRGVNLGIVKRHCHALHALSPSGPDGYVWRVRMDSSTGLSWWDVQDEHADLPVLDRPLGEIGQIFEPADPSEEEPEETGSPDSSVRGGERRGGGGTFGKFSKVLKSAARELNAGVERNLTGGGGPSEEEMFVNTHTAQVVAFKLLDWAAAEQKFLRSRGGRPQTRPAVTRRPASGPAPSKPQGPAPQAAPVPSVPPVPSSGSIESLLGFDSPAVPDANASLAAAAAILGAQPTFNVVPPAGTVPPAKPPPQENRAQRLRRQQMDLEKTQEKVWDDVEQRWAVVGSKNQAGKASSRASPRGYVAGEVASSTPQGPGVKLDANALNTAKSAVAREGIQKRLKDMNDAQQTAVRELREREQAKVVAENEEDEVRRRLEPQVKAWAEEYGKKRAMRALLANLHKIMWPEANWKQVNLGDILDDKKARRCYLKATLKVHPDKTKDLDAEKRFLAKRIFDALTQAQTVFEEQSR